MSNEASLDMQSGSLVSVIETSTGEAFHDCGVINKLKKYEYYIPGTKFIYIYVPACR